MPIVWVLLTAVLAAPRLEVETLSGTRAAGQLQAFDSESITLIGDDGPRTLPLDELIDVTLAAQDVGRPAGTQVALSDGSHLMVDEFTTRERVALLARPARETQELPLAAVQSVRFAGASPANDGAWQRIATLAAAADLLVLRSGDALDHLEGEIVAVSDTQVEFLTDGETFNVKRAKLEGLVYANQPADGSAAMCVVHLVDRSTVVARRVTWQEGSFRIAAAADFEIELPPESIARLDFSQGKIVHLSDLDWDPARYERTSFFAVPNSDPGAQDLFQPRRDRSFDGGPLQLGGIDYPRGLALHSRTRLVYRLPGEFRRFTALAGIDDRIRPRGNVQLRIAADGRTLLDEVITGADDPLPIDLDITGARRLELVVDFGTDLDVGDHLNLCQPRMMQ